jgi:hypothetical protein
VPGTDHDHLSGRRPTRWCVAHLPLPEPRRQEPGDRRDHRCGDQRRRTQAATDAQVEASWHQRALNAEDALKAAHAEIDTQRERIGILLGQLRDLQAEGTAQRLAVENTTLKQRVRQLTEDNRGLEQKLQAARSNNRFLDKRLADLEAELLDTQLTQAAAIPQRQP